MEKLSKQLEKKLDLANVLKIKEKTENELEHRLKYCTFCKIVSPDEHNQIIFQNQILVIFDDIKRIKNVNHLLAVPKNHVKDINKAGFSKYPIHSIVPHDIYSGVRHLEEDTPHCT